MSDIIKIHNSNNEQAWEEVLRWEAMHARYVIFTQISHYENMPMQYTEIFYVVKNENFQLKIYIFLIFAQNIDFGYTLEPPR